MKTKEEQFAEIKLQIGKIQYEYLGMSKDKKAIEANPSTHRIAEWVQHRESKWRELYEAQKELIKIQATFGTVGNAMLARQKITLLEQELGLTDKK